MWCGILYYIILCYIMLYYVMLYYRWAGVVGVVWLLVLCVSSRVCCVDECCVACLCCFAVLLFMFGAYFAGFVVWCRQMWVSL